MSELFNRSILKRLALPRAFMQDMLLPYRGQAGATYESSWGGKDMLGQKRYRVSLTSPQQGERRAVPALKPRRDGSARICRRREAVLGPAHADVLIALMALEQGLLDNPEQGELGTLSFKMLWRVMHGFRDCGNYSGAWRQQVMRALRDLSRCRMTLTDRGENAGAGREPLVVSGPLLSVFWVRRTYWVAGREIETEAVERILWGPALRHMLAESLTMTFRADEYFSIRCRRARVAYLFAPAPAAARARDVSRNLPDGAVPAEFSQRSTTLLLKLGFAPDEVADRYSRHRLLAPMQQALDRRPLANGHLSVSLTRHHPPTAQRSDWRLSLRVTDRRPNSAGVVEDVSFLAAMEGGRTRSELHSALRRLPELEHRESDAIAQIWPAATRSRATAWARKVKAMMLPEDRTLFADILSEVKSRKAEGFRFRKAAAAMAVGLAHNVLRTHEWPLQGRSGAPPPRQAA